MPEPSKSTKVLLGIIIVSVFVMAALVFGLQNKKGLDPPPKEIQIEAENTILSSNQKAKQGFRDATAESGITFRMKFLAKEQGVNFKTNLYDHGSGVAIGDFDGDGHDDIYLVNQLGPNALYKNKGDGTFIDVTEKAGVALGDRICVMAVFGDYDNDGHQDLFVTSTRGGNVLFRNLGNGTFKDVTQEAGLTHVGHSYAATFFDFDNDGYLDLLVTNTAQWTLNTFDQVSKYFPGKNNLIELAACPVEHNILYHNNGDGTFTDVTDKARLKGLGWGGDIAVFDYNEDGYVDVLITNMFGRAQLYRNNGNGTFTDVTLEVLGRTSWGGMGAKVFDFNNDGKLDLYIVDMHSDMWIRPSHGEKMVEEKKKYPYVNGRLSVSGPRAKADEEYFADLFKVRYNEVLFGNTLFKNLGKQKFEEVSDKAGMETWWPWGIATGDFDNDGYEDTFIPSGMGYPFWYWPNYLMMNNGNETFTDRTGREGIEPPRRGRYAEELIGEQPASRSSRAAAVADFDGDGRLDLIVNNFNDSPYYFRNNFPKRDFVAFRLTGTKSNRDAIGSVVTIHCGQEVMTRLVQSASGYLAQSSKTVHFGLGERSKIDRVEIKWPRGKIQTIENPGINTVHKLSEPKN